MNFDLGEWLWIVIAEYSFVVAIGVSALYVPLAEIWQITQDSSSKINFLFITEMRYVYK